MVQEEIDGDAAAVGSDTHPCKGRLTAWATPRAGASNTPRAVARAEVTATGPARGALPTRLPSGCDGANDSVNGHAKFQALLPPSKLGGERETREFAR